jgi:hypothetical protein
MTNALIQFLRQTPPRRGLLIEAALGLLLARLALRVLPFRRLKPFFNRPVHGPEVDGPARQRLQKEVVWAIRRTAEFLPGKTVCFPRGIVAQAMLRRRGVATTLYYGVMRLPAGSPVAHVWVQDGAQGVVGHHSAEACHILARYPES